MSILPLLKTNIITQNKRIWVLFAACILGFMIQIDYTAVNVAIPVMSLQLNTPLTTIQWVLSAYVLACGAMVIPAGRLSDLYGKRRLFIIGNSVFILGSALTGLAMSAWFVITSRIIQGIGAALFIPSLYTLVFTAYPESERGKALGILTSAFALGMAVGPTLGGFLIHFVSWRYIFFINVPLGLIVIGIILAIVDKEPWKLLNEKFDFIGAITLIITVVLLNYGILQIRYFQFYHYTIAIFITILILLSMFLFYEKRQKYPILQLDLFKNRAYIGCISINTLLGYNFAALLITGGLYLQNGLAYSPFETGMAFLAMTIALGILSIYGGKVCDWVPKYIPVMLGSLATICATLIFISLNLHSPLWLILSMFILAGIGLGLAFPALNLAMMASVKDEQLNIASGTFTMFGAIGNSMGLILSAVSIVFFGQSILMQLLKQAGLTINTAQAQKLLAIISSANYSSIDLTNFPSITINILHQAFIKAMRTSLSIALTFAVLSLLLAWILLKENREKP